MSVRKRVICDKRLNFPFKFEVISAFLIEECFSSVRLEFQSLRQDLFNGSPMFSLVH